MSTGGGSGHHFPPLPLHSLSGTSPSHTKSMATTIAILLLFISLDLNQHNGSALAWSFGTERQKSTDRAFISSPLFGFGNLDDQTDVAIDTRRTLTDKLMSTLATSAIIFGLTASVLPHSCQAAAYTPIQSSIQTSSPTANDDDFINSLDLKPATESQPQIKLPASYKDPSKSNVRRPLIQGLVYFAEQQTMGSSFPQDYNDVLVLTVLPVNGDEILAGAKLPIASTRFPLLFQMYKENVLLKGREDMWLGTNGGEQQDVFVEARICPRDSAKFPCNEREQKRYAKGIAKAISGLPGLEEGEVIRAPASLPLQ